MFESNDLIFNGTVTKTKRDNSGVYTMVNLANPELFENFDLFVPPELLNTCNAMVPGDKVRVVIKVGAQGFSLRTDLIKITKLNK